MLIRSYYVFFKYLSNLLNAREFKPKDLKANEYFDISSARPFILWNSIKCRKIFIEASEKNPLYGSSLSIHLNHHSQNNKNANLLRLKRLLNDFKSQSFFSGGFLCLHKNLDSEWEYETEGGSKRIKGAQYFLGINTLVKYCYNEKLINMKKLNKKEKNLINLELKAPEIFTQDFLKKFQKD